MGRLAIASRRDGRRRWRHRGGLGGGGIDDNPAECGSNIRKQRRFHGIEGSKRNEPGRLIESPLTSTEHREEEDNGEMNQQHQ